MPRSRHKKKNLLDWIERTAEPRWLGTAIGMTYALLIVFVGLIFHTSGDAASESDFFANYVAQARAVLSGAIVIDAYRGPVYPIALGLLHLVLQIFRAGLFETGIVLSAISGGVAVAIAHRLTALLFTPRHALIVALLMVTNPVFIRYSYTTGNDMLFVVVAIAAAWLFLRMKKPTRPGLVAAGVMAALVYLTRYNGVAILVAMVVAVLFVNIWRRRWRERLVHAVILVATFFVVIAPWGIYCSAKVGRFFYNNNHVNIALGVYSTESDADRFRRDNPPFTSLADVVLRDPAKFVSSTPLRTLRHFNTMVSRVTTFAVGSTALLGVFLLLLRGPTRRELSYYLFGVIYFIPITMVFYSDRFFLFLIPICITLAVRGVFFLLDALGDSLRARKGTAAIIAVLVVLSVLSAVPYNVRFIGGGTAVERQLGRQFRESLAAGRPGARVVSRMPHFAYYAGLEFVRMPLVASYEEFLEFVRETNANFVFFGRSAVRTRRELITLADPKVPHDGLRVVTVTPAGVLYVVE